MPFIKVSAIFKKNNKSYAAHTRRKDRRRNVFSHNIPIRRQFAIEKERASWTLAMQYWWLHCMDRLSVFIRLSIQQRVSLSEGLGKSALGMGRMHLIIACRHFVLIFSHYYISVIVALELPYQWKEQVYKQKWNALGVSKGVGKSFSLEHNCSMVLKRERSPVLSCVREAYCVQWANSGACFKLLCSYQWETGNSTVLAAHWVSFILSCNKSYTNLPSIPTEKTCSSKEPFKCCD